MRTPPLWMASVTARKKSGSRTVSTTGAPSRTPDAVSRVITRLAHCTLPSAETAITASCMLLSKVSSCCWPVRIPRKLCSSWCAVESSAAATWPISSEEFSAMRAVRSPEAMRAAKSTMRRKRRATDCAAINASTTATSTASPDVHSSVWRTPAVVWRSDASAYAAITTANISSSLKKTRLLTWATRSGSQCRGQCAGSAGSRRRARSSRGCGARTRPPNAG